MWEWTRQVRQIWLPSCSWNSPMSSVQANRRRWHWCGHGFGMLPREQHLQLIKVYRYWFRLQHFKCKRCWWCFTWIVPGEIIVWRLDGAYISELLRRSRNHLLIAVYSPHLNSFWIEFFGINERSEQYWAGFENWWEGNTWTDRWRWIFFRTFGF